MVPLHPPEKISEIEQPASQFEDASATKNDDRISVNFFQLFRFATTKDYSLLILATIAALGTGPCLSIAVILFGDLANIFVIYAGDSTKENVTQPVCLNGSLYSENKGRLLQSNGDNIMDDVVNYAIGTGLVGVSSLVFNLIFVTGFSIAAQNQIYRLRSTFFVAILKQEIAWYDTRTSDGFAARISEDLNKIHDGIGEKVGLFLSNLSLSVCCFITAIYYGWELSLIMLASLPILSITTGILAKIQASLAAREVESYAVAGGLAEEVIGHIRTVTVYGTQSKEAERFESSLKPAVHAGIQRGLATGIGSGFVWLLTYASYALAFWYGIGLVFDDCSGYDAGTLNIVFFNALYSALKLGQLLPYIQAFSVARSAATGVYRIIDRIPLIDSSSRQGKCLDRLEGQVRFEGVDFSYPSRLEVPILNALTLDVPAGRTIALVGPSGCGKSTCIQLLQRFYDPTKGRVLIDGRDLKELNVSWLRDQIGVVGQEPSLFDMSVAENIKYGARREGQKITQEDIERAARKANADVFIRSLPNGYDTLVGERGAQLSGGQKQRIAIARAIVRDPKILLLDEATSALDTQSELVVQTALEKARKGRTTLIVAHRLSTIRNADWIFVFNKGKVEEEGKHQELMEMRGIYHHLVMSQEQNDDGIESSNQDDDKCSNVAVKPIKLEESIKPPAHPNIETEEDELEQPSTSTATQGVSIWMILRLTKQTEWLYNLLGLFGATLMGISTPIYAVVFGEVMGLLALTNDDSVQTKRNFFTYMFLVIAVGAGLGAFLQTFAFSVAGERLTFRLRTLSFQAILRKNIGWFDLQENSVGSLCARLSNDASAVQGATGARIGFLLQVSISIIFAVSLSLFYDWKLALASAVFVPIVLLAAILETKIGMGQNDNKALETSSKIASEALSSIRTVASLGKEDAFHASYMKSLLLSFKQSRRRSPIRGLVFGIANNVTTFASIVSMSYGGYLIQNEDLDYKTVFIIGEALIFGMEMIGQTLAFTPNFGKAKIAAGRIFELLDQKNDSKDNPQSSFPDFVEGKIEFDDVTFTYPTRPNVSILNGMSAVMLPSKTVAIVGPSGCGKSTVIQLIQRFYDPESGSIKLDNHHLNSMPQDSLRRNIGIVSQEPALFDRTLAENIAYGTDNYRPVTTAEIIEAARKSNIHTFIQSLPMGYETKVGQRGVQLSGGQKQRVAIARALVRNPKVLLLDEATSALDSESEKVVQEALNVASQGRTCISIAHRLSTIQHADIILVVNQGRVLEQGKHDDLIQLKGMYHQLWTVQGLSNKQ